MTRRTLTTPVVESCSFSWPRQRCCIRTGGGPPEPPEAFGRSTGGGRLVPSRAWPLLRALVSPQHVPSSGRPPRAELRAGAAAKNTAATPARNGRCPRLAPCKVTAGVPSVAVARGLSGTSQKTAASLPPSVPAPLSYPLPRRILLLGAFPVRLHPCSSGADGSASVLRPVASPREYPQLGAAVAARPAVPAEREDEDQRLSPPRRLADIAEPPRPDRSQRPGVTAPRVPSAR